MKAKSEGRKKGLPWREYLASRSACSLFKKIVRLQKRELRISVQPLDFLEESIHSSLAFRFGKDRNGWGGGLLRTLSIVVVTQIKDGHTLADCGRRPEA